MPGDPKECREHARRCAELASVATTPEAREQFISLQQSWMRLAADLENAQAFIAALDEIDADPPVEPRSDGAAAWLKKIAKATPPNEEVG